MTCSEAQAVLDALASRDARPSPSEALDAAEALIGMYPAREATNARTYTAAMTALLSAYPRDFIKRVVNPVTGLPSRLKFLPTLAEVREALDAEKARRDQIAANARYVIACHDKARRQAEAEAEWQRNRPDAETRAKQVAELVAELGLALAVMELPRAGRWRPPQDSLNELARRKAERETAKGGTQG